MAPALPNFSDYYNSSEVAELLANVQFVIFVYIGFTKYIAPPRPVAKLSSKVELMTLELSLSFNIRAAPTDAVRLLKTH